MRRMMLSSEMGVLLCAGMLAGWTVASADGVPFEDWTVAGTFSHNSYSDACIAGIAVSTSSPPQVLASAYRASQGLFRSENGGEAWTNIGPGNFGEFAINPSDQALMLATQLGF